MYYAYGLRGYNQWGRVRWKLTSSKPVVSYYDNGYKNAVYDIQMSNFILAGDSWYHSTTGGQLDSVAMNENNGGNATHLPAMRHPQRRGNFSFADGRVESIYGPVLVRGNCDNTNSYSYRFDTYWMKKQKFGRFNN